MRIGIMGGTFDPVHLGHLLVAEQVREQMKLDEVWFMPSNKPPHKDQESNVEPQQRLEMVRLAIANHPQFKLCQLEFERGGTSYTVDSATVLTERFPNDQFYWIIGADMVQYLPQWYKIEQLIHMLSFIGVERPGYENCVQAIPDWLRHSLIMIKMPQYDISSTEIRERLTTGQSVRYMIPETVMTYIGENRLYGT